MPRRKATGKASQRGLIGKICPSLPTAVIDGDEELCLRQDRSAADTHC